MTNPNTAGGLQDAATGTEPPADPNSPTGYGPGRGELQDATSPGTDQP